jgi:putative transposase
VRPEATSIDQFAFEGGEETLAHCIVVGVADRACRWTNAGFLAASAESAQYTSEQFQRLTADNGVDCSMSRSGNVWDNAAMESFFSSLKTERIGRKVYRTRDAARADVFDYIERFYNTIRRHSTNGYLSPVEFERKVGLA